MWALKILAATRSTAQLGAAALLALCLSCTVSAQTAKDDPDWAESEVPAPPSVNFEKLVPFDGARSSSLSYGVDPATIRFSPTDGLLRYVVVASSRAGNARNVMYEAIRCSTGEFKTYARYSNGGRWNAIQNAEWQSLFDSMPSKHALYFARAGACQGAAPSTSAQEIVRRLKTQNLNAFGD